jgi:hypothetical protein
MARRKAALRRRQTQPVPGDRESQNPESRGDLGRCREREGRNRNKNRNQNRE